VIGRRRGMARKRGLRSVGGLLVVVILLLGGCGGGGTEEAAVPDSGAAVVEEKTVVPEESGGEPVAEVEATPAPEDLFPDVLVVHPDAHDIVATPASGTFVYVIPGMVAEAMEYMLTELKARGWEELGQPTLMGHLATLTLRMDKDRLTISMQDNEISETTRVQMLLMQQ
jgi:hypothetical protein